MGLIELATVAVAGAVSGAEVAVGAGLEAVVEGAGGIAEGLFEIAVDPGAELEGIETVAAAAVVAGDAGAAGCGQCAAVSGYGVGRFAEELTGWFGRAGWGSGGKLARFVRRRR